MPKSASPDHALLSQQWIALFNRSPPRKSSTEFLRQAVGWQVQAQKLGGLDSFSRKALNSGKVSSVLAPDTKLIRQWQNASYQVTVVGNGFEYDGKTYRSLSATAKDITGTNWNGRVFFGVKS